MGRKLIMACVFGTGMIFAGCVQYRANCVVLPPNEGEAIHTRNKYRIESYEIEYEEGAHYSPTLWAEYVDGESQYSKMKDFAIKLRPDVFSENGIPIRMHGICNSTEDTSWHYLSFFSLGILPESRTIDSTWTYRVEIGDGMPVESSMTVTARLDTKTSAFSPVAWMITIDDKECPQGRVFGASEKYMRIGNLDFTDANQLESLRHEAISYGLASLLKRFENNRAGIKSR